MTDLMTVRPKSLLGRISNGDQRAGAGTSLLGGVRHREIKKAKHALETLRALTGFSYSALANDAGFAASTVSRFMAADNPSFVIKPQTLRAILNRSAESAMAALEPAELEVVRSLETTDLIPPALSVPAKVCVEILRLRRATFNEPSSGEPVTKSFAPESGPTRIVGAVEAGVFRDAFEIPIEDQDTLPVGSDRYGPNSFALEVRGDSMDKLFPAGSLLICRPFDPESEPLPDQKLVVAMRRDARTDSVEATVKRLVKLVSGENYVLLPESHNPIHAPLPLEDLGEFSVYISAIVLAAVTTV